MAVEASAAVGSVTVAGCDDLGVQAAESSGPGIREQQLVVGYSMSTAGRLDSVAKVLAGATAAVAALLTAFGLTSERVWLLLDQDRLASRIVVFGICAIVAIGSSLVALLLPPTRLALQAVVLGVGALFYVTALVGVLLVAGKIGDRAGAPIIQSASVRHVDATSVLDLHVVGQQLDADQSVAITVRLGKATLYESAIPPDFEGHLDQTVSIPLPPSVQDGPLEVVAWRSDRTSDPDCSDVGAHGPSCMTIFVTEDGSPTG